jgi:hypothetical protein
LGLVNREHGFDCLEFDEHAFVDQKVKSQRFFPDEAFVPDLDNPLLSDWQTAQFELLREAPFIDGFNETGAFVTVYFNSSTNDDLRKAGGFRKQGMHSSVSASSAASCKI